MRLSRNRLLRVPALRIQQHPEYPLYVFALTSRDLWRIADVARIARDETGRLAGYQRPAAKRHIRNIVEYLNSGPVLFPNSLILALSGDVRFVPRYARTKERTAYGRIEIPVPANGNGKPAWIVDGQQRALALASANCADLLVPVNGFLADDVAVQREQFLRVNSVKPLPRGLTTELLPEIDSVLPRHLTTRRLPAAICQMLNVDPESPFRGLISRASGSQSRTRPCVSDTTLVRILQDSLSNPAGCLFSHRNLGSGDVDWEAVRWTLLTYWAAVRDTFPEAWGLAPSRSRLMHSVGLRAMGKLMNKMMQQFFPFSSRADVAIRQELTRLAPRCHWTSGHWQEMGGMRWNELQNVPSHVRMLSNHLVRCYLDEEASVS